MKHLLPAFAAAVLLTACVPPAQQNAQTPDAPAQNEPAGDRADMLPLTGSGMVSVEERLLPSGVLELGNPAAPVSLLLFTNHACAYCRTFHDELLPRLNADYIQSGRVRIGIVPFALQKYADSNESASLLLCAARQGKGAAMHALLFRTNASARTFGDELTAIGINPTDLQTCTQEEGIRGTLAAQQSMAQSLGVSLVPAYFVNGQMFLGQPQYADLRGQIEAALTE